MWNFLYGCTNDDRGLFPSRSKTIYYFAVSPPASPSLTSESVTFSSSPLLQHQRQTENHGRWVILYKVRRHKLEISRVEINRKASLDSVTPRSAPEHEKRTCGSRAASSYLQHLPKPQSQQYALRCSFTLAKWEAASISRRFFWRIFNAGTISFKSADTRDFSLRVFRGQTNHLLFDEIQSNWSLFQTAKCRRNLKKWKSTRMWWNCYTISKWL